jgi:hypothetical protein
VSAARVAAIHFRLVRRLLFNLAAAASLLLMLAVAAMWVRSFAVSDHWINQYRCENTAHTNSFASRSGSITLAMTSDERVSSAVGAFDNLSTDRLHCEHFTGLAELPDHWYECFNTFFYDRIDARDGQQNRLRLIQVTFPHWLLILLTAIIPAVRLAVAMRARRRRSTGRCKTCGYDLRATPERCPECGTAATESQRAQQQGAGEVAAGDC